MLNFIQANAELFKLVLVVASLMGANTLFKIATCSQSGAFEWRILVKGLIKYLLVLLGVTSMIVAGSLLPDMAIVAVGDTSITILQALSAGMTALIVIYAGKCIENLKEMFGIKTEDVSKLIR